MDSAILKQFDFCYTQIQASVVGSTATFSASVGSSESFMQVEKMTGCGGWIYLTFKPFRILSQT